MERLWTKSFILISAGTLFLFNAFYMLYPTLPLFIQQIGGSETHVGLSMGAFMLTSVIIRPIVGGLLDRYGRRRFIVWGLLLFILAMYMYDWIGGIVVLIGLRVFHGMTWAVSSTAISTAVTDIIPPSRRGEGMGWFSTSMTLAMAFGPMIGLLLVQHLSYHALFRFAVVLSALALLLILGARIPFRPQADTRKIELFEKSVLPVSISVFFMFFAYGGITTFVPLFADSIKVNSGLFFLVFAATLALSRPLSGKLSDRYGERAVIVPALIVTIAALICLSFSTGSFGLLASAVLYGIGFGSAHPALQSATLRLARPDRKGVANASLATATDLGIGLGAMILGWISRYTGYSVLFQVSAMTVVLSLFVFALVVRRSLTANPGHTDNPRNAAG
ncbi:Tetracycline resistance protein, class B [Paenibacillus konkukensis]|uniref:Tetracycline resistance protein, class B n=1 Tax=Paenibacillus konkukensis TaxID=2020716 RepID=A0ABY4RI91_9BACL|nr:MFS transporter [Paenibacillus konkukensis]UQZ81157.1 Tetracycline resistance protein, class B [Paenibacillus konkukensis]